LSALIAILIAIVNPDLAAANADRVPILPPIKVPNMVKTAYYHLVLGFQIPHSPKKNGLAYFLLE
jgi:hypothetical protein